MSLRRKRQFAPEHKVDNYSCREDVHLFIVALALNDLRGHVARRAHALLHALQVVQLAGDSEIYQDSTLPMQHNVLCFHIAVDDAIAMQVDQSREDAHHDLHHVLLLDDSVRYQVEQVAAGAELRDGDPLRLLVRLRARLAKHAQQSADVGVPAHLLQEADLRSQGVEVVGLVVPHLDRHHVEAVNAVHIQQPSVLLHELPSSRGRRPRRASEDCTLAARTQAFPGDAIALLHIPTQGAASAELEQKIGQLLWFTCTHA
mmetsp:Transcript_72379/g.172889  ORF Transcript_72379/g.172889 Transcript_72379/m.172889 type:complete len:259 (+) Transcript_72379:895-1671(+)